MKLFTENHKENLQPDDILLYIKPPNLDTETEVERIRVMIGFAPRYVVFPGFLPNTVEVWREGKRKGTFFVSSPCNTYTIYKLCLSV